MDPADFLSVAARLRASPSEAERRTSVGRSYYGLYNVLRARFRTVANLQGTSRDHGRLITYLTESNDARMQQVGEKLKNLRDLRNDADYEMDGPIDAAQSELAYQWAREAVRILIAS